MAGTDSGRAGMLVAHLVDMVKRTDADDPPRGAVRVVVGGGWGGALAACPKACCATRAPGARRDGDEFELASFS